MAISAQTYLLASTVMGFAQVIDAVALLRSAGRTPGRRDALATLFSFAEYAWAVVSFLVWKGGHEAVPAWLPASFVSYVVLMMLVGIAIVSAAATKQDRNPEVPAWCAALGGVFGLCFCIAASAVHLRGG